MNTTTTTTTHITVTDVELRYPGAGRGGRALPPVVGPLSVDVTDGVVGLVGRNGAGKTTLLGLLAGQLRPSAGRVVSCGRDAFDDAVVLENTSFTGVDIDYVPAWTVQGILQLSSQRHPNWDWDEAERLREGFGLAELSRYGGLSRGQRTAVGIIIGLASHTPVTLLDEPYVGLDAQARRLFYRALMESVEADPRLVVVSTHHLPDLERIVDRVLVMDRGQLTHDIAAEDLEGRFFRVTGSSSRVDTVVSALSDSSTGRLLSRDDLAGASRAVVDLGSGTDSVFADVVTEPLGLEDAVVQLTGGGPS
ncbi:MAG: ATP-binding cassette domain-containing protein [Mycobacteriaceae bacterium]|uniref:ATP-binding cassette domain-containing protein n=1 Tax=Corynebacterium sp. TaxID=1720 RepID=UPI003F9DF127